jgi:hypothetical protein
MATDGVPPVDLDAIVASYAPNAAIARLLFIADRAKERGRAEDADVQPDATETDLQPAHPHPSPSSALELDALRRAHDLLRASENTSLYVSVCERLDGRLGDAYRLDRSWVDVVDANAARRKDILEAELGGYKTNAIKESIRMGYVDLGDFYRARGDAANAFKAYARTREYCTTARQVVSTCLNIARVGVESGNFAHVLSHVAKAASAAGIGHTGNGNLSGSSPGRAPGPAHTVTAHAGLTTAPVGTSPSADPVALAELARAAGLAFLEARKYPQAARKFSEACAYAASARVFTSEGDGLEDSSGGRRGDSARGGPAAGAASASGTPATPFSAPAAASGMRSRGDADKPLSEILCSRDVATCGVLCGLASLDRDETKKRLCEDPSFRSAAEGEPRVRAIADDFVNHRFADALRGLERVRGSLYYDVHLHEHVGALFAKIREKALAQYCAPYSVLCLGRMAEAFLCDVPELESELTRLILDGAVDARVDSANKTLRARARDSKRASRETARIAGEDYVRGAKAALVRVRLSERDVVVGRDPSTFGRPLGGFGGFGAGNNRRPFDFGVGVALGGLGHRDGGRGFEGARL